MVYLWDCLHFLFFYHFTIYHFLLFRLGILFDLHHFFFPTSNILKILFHHSNNIGHIHFSYHFHISLHIFFHYSNGKHLSHASYYLTIIHYKHDHHNAYISPYPKFCLQPIAHCTMIHQPINIDLPLTLIHS